MTDGIGGGAGRRLLGAAVTACVPTRAKPMCLSSVIAVVSAKVAPIFYN